MDEMSTLTSSSTMDLTTGHVNAMEYTMHGTHHGPLDCTMVHSMKQFSLGLLDCNEAPHGLCHGPYRDELWLSPWCAAWTVLVV